MDKIRINTGSLRNTEKTVHGSLTSIQNKISKMKDDIAQMNAMWSGQAHDAFNTAFLADAEALGNLVNSMMGIARFEDNAAAEYDRCESSVHSLVAAIRV